ncbi:MAG: SURF1 family protein [Proteobacteria bacterium]|nr:SURF1 family protein [Pseudomonadota bacterium]
MMRSLLPGRFQPGLWPTLFTVPAVLFMVALSVWQVQRLYWKEALINERIERTTAAPVALPADGAKLDEAEFRRVALNGQFDHAHEFLMPARSQNGNVGFWVVTPFHLVVGGDVLVNRGWVPDGFQDPKQRMGGQLAGDVSLDGILRLPQVKSWFQPDNEPEKNRWFYLSPAEMAKASGLPFRTDLYLDAVKTEIPGNYPLGGQTRIQLPNDHLQYAITWGALALALAVIYAIHGFKTGTKPKE